MKKKLGLEVLDPAGNAVVTQHFFYEAGQGNELRLTITDNVYIMDSNGKLIILTQEEINKKSTHKGNVDFDDPKTKEWLGNMRDSLNENPLTYHNPKTNKTEKFFDENTLIPVWTVGVTNDNIVIGDKGCSVFLTVEAEDMEHAKDKAMLCDEFMQHIRIKDFDRKYLHVDKPKGNYVIGEVSYFEGNERL